MTPQYRPDIDGLRGIAVLSVLLFHSGFSLFSGGYVGVDVFFVISGFLITTIIVREIGEGTFSLTGFYERRFRRILPAVVTTVLGSLLLGYFLLIPREFESLARSAAASNFFVSNILFYRETGYFDAPGEKKPLLHTWSLSVEEQYYVVIPLLLLLISRLGSKNYLHWLLPIFLFSFGASVLVTTANPSAGFYLLPTRAWELLTGSLLAISAFPRITHSGLLNALAGLGLVLMTWSVLAFSKDTVFPGAAAAVPTIGAALVIYAGSQGRPVCNKLLMFRPLVFVGLISYSLYLWHWPLLVYARNLKITELEATERVLLIVLMLVVSALSWRYVETPFRKRRWLAGTGALLGASFATIAVLGALSFSLSVADGLPLRSQFVLSPDEMVGDPEWVRWAACNDPLTGLTEDSASCRLGKLEGDPEFLFWGDSHARALAPGVNESALRSGSAGVIAFRDACPALLDVERPGRRACNQFNRSVLTYLESHPELELVIIAARWALSTKGTRYKLEDGDGVDLVDLSGEREQLGDNVRLFEKGLRRTVAALVRMGKRVVLVGSVPEIGYYVPSANHSARITGRDVNAVIAPTRAEFTARNREVFEILRRMQHEFGVVLVNPSASLCGAESCRVSSAQGVALYRDDDHLSTFGARYISGIFDTALKQAPVGTQ